MSKGGLGGGGLNALFASSSEEYGTKDDINEGTTEVALDLIVPNPNQPRTSFDEAGIQELANSIQTQGLLQPIVVRPAGKKYQIIAGERRWQACRSLDMKKVPVRIMRVDDQKMLELALIENLQRSDLNAIEEAKGYKRLTEMSKLTQAQVAETVSKSRSAIANAMRLLDLPEEVQELLYNGSLSAGHARAILALPDDESRIEVAKKVALEKRSVRDTENLVRLKAAGKSEHTPRVPTPRLYKAVARKLRQSFDTNVRVKTVQGKNRIEIEFKDEEDLERLFDLISKKE